MASSSIIHASSVAKRYGDFEALSRFDLEVAKGECVGLLGPNGAGKTTFIGCLYGVVLRSSGDLTIFGHDPALNSRAIKSRLGVVPQENALDEGLTVRENMRIYARFGGLTGKPADERIDELLGLMSLESKSDNMIRMLSGGMKRRLTFVRALLSDPELLVLDEPTTGLDPSVRHLLWEKVIDLKKSGKTILVTTHYMHEAEILCDRIVVLNKGEAVGVGKPKDMIAREAPGFVGIFPTESEDELRKHVPPEWDLYQQSDQCCVRAPEFGDLITLQQRAGIDALQLRPANLEDVYLKLTGHELEEADVSIS
ncbi:MAG: ABC transporter ATP-binding protein [Verrucomicrobiota bacterium]